MIEHKTGIVELLLGWRWKCSCGQNGYTVWPYAQKYGAEAQAADHTAYHERVAQITGKVPE